MPTIQKKTNVHNLILKDNLPLKKPFSDLDNPRVTNPYMETLVGKLWHLNDGSTTDS